MVSCGVHSLLIWGGGNFPTERVRAWDARRISISATHLTFHLSYKVSYSVRESGEIHDRQCFSNRCVYVMSIRCSLCFQSHTTIRTRVYVQLNLDNFSCAAMYAMLRKRHVECTYRSSHRDRLGQAESEHGMIVDVYAAI